VNLYLRALAEAIDGPRDYYAWIITKDHLAECEGHDGTSDAELLAGVNIGTTTYCDGTCNPGEAGTTGPSTAPQALLDRLAAGQGHTFRMYDDDGELYYTGRLLRDEDNPRYDEDTALRGPLADYGEPNAGAVRIEYHGHPEWGF